MSFIIAAGLMLGASVAADTHRTQIDHRGHRVDITYRSDLAVTRRQVGVAAPGGRAGTLRCVWSARVSVAREARSTAGHVLTRTLSSDRPISGSRAGWCDGQRAAIAAEVAARSDTVRAHLMALADEDRATLAAELDTVHADARS